MLVSPAGALFFLRSMGKNAGHQLGGVGIQFIGWTAESDDDLSRCERVLKEHSAYAETRGGDGLRVVEGRDPDGIAVVITYPGPEQVNLRKLPVRIYAW